MDLLIENGTIVNRGRSFSGYVLISGDRIAATGEGSYPAELQDNFRGRRIDARGKLVLPGVIDDQVHFREPGLTRKGDIASESAAAVAGGVTSFMDMPNTVPPTTSIGEWERKNERAQETSHANWAFYFGATNDNIEQIAALDPKKICGVKLFMGSSTGNMLVDDPKTLAAIFDRSPVLIATHCEDEAMIRRLAADFKARYGDKIPPAYHAEIRSAEACYRSSAQAVSLADRYGSNLHVLHMSTACELALFDAKPLSDKKITNEVCVHHLWFSLEDYAEKGNLIKWNPSIKTQGDRDALRAGLLNNKVDVVATDHAPHTREEKSRPYWECPSGAPMVQHSLTAMLELSRQGVLSVDQVVEKMCHAPAMRYGVEGRGFLDAGMYADVVIVDPDSEWTVAPENILYKCGWSPLEATTLRNRVQTTILNGRIAYCEGVFSPERHAAQLTFKGLPR